MVKKWFWLLFECFIDKEAGTTTTQAAHFIQIFMLTAFFLLALILNILGLFSFISSHQIIFGIIAIILGVACSVASSYLSKTDISLNQMKICMAIISLTLLFLLSTQRLELLITLAMFLVFANFAISLTSLYIVNSKIVYALLAVILLGYIIHWYFGEWGLWNVFKIINFLLLFSIILIEISTIANMRITTLAAYDFTPQELQSEPFRIRVFMEAIRKDPVKAGVMFGFIHFFYIAESISVLLGGVTDSYSSDNR